MQIFQLKPGREVGIIKNKLKEAILDGDIPNEYEASLQFVIKTGQELGLFPVNAISNEAK